MAQRLYKPLLIDSILAQADLTKQRFIGFDGNACTEGALALGVCDVETEAGQYAPIGILGILLIETGGAIAQGASVVSDSTGRAIVGRGYSNGYALDAATSEGEVIRIVRGI